MVPIPDLNMVVRACMATHIVVEIMKQAAPDKSHELLQDFGWGIKNASPDVDYQPLVDAIFTTVEQQRREQVTRLVTEPVRTLLGQPPSMS